MENMIEYKVYGKFALFTDPLTKAGGEKYSYAIPTYEALRGITESIYWKPCLSWIIDRVRIMKPIRMQSKGIRPLVYRGGNTLSLYTYLFDVEYQVQAHFLWNENRKDLARDWNPVKHLSIAQRMIDRGGRRDVFLGTRECQGYVEPCAFGEGKGAFDSLPEMGFSLMLHGFNYPDETNENFLGVRFWQPNMKNGIIDFILPSECQVVRKIRHYAKKTISIGNNYSLEIPDEEGL